MLYTYYLYIIIHYLHICYKHVCTFIYTLLICINLLMNCAYIVLNVVEV